LQRGDFIANEVPGMIWKEEQRDALVKPTNVTDVRIEPDEMHEGNVKVSLQFALPRGAYATMVIKRLFAPSWYSRPTDRDEPRAPRTPGGVNLQPRSIVRYDDDYED
jgi:tRNA pseudouridine13 synthase